MARFIKQCIFTLLVMVVGFYACGHLPLKEMAKRKIVDYFGQHGITIASMEIETLLPIGVDIRNIEVTSPTHYTLGLFRLDVLRNRITLENLVVPKLLDDKDVTFNVNAHIGFPQHMPGVVAELSGQPGDIAAQFSMITVHGKQEASKVHIDSASMRYEALQGAQLAVQNVDMNSDAPVSTTLHINDLPLQTLLRTLVHPQVEATGNLNGDVPLEYDGRHVQVLGFSFNATGPGMLKLPPGLLPATSDQELLAARALGDFSYSKLGLSVAASADASKGAPMELAVEGTSPALYGGQAAALKVNLGNAALTALNQALGGR